jgi:hypothetical protein
MADVTVNSIDPETGKKVQVSVPSMFLDSKGQIKPTYQDAYNKISEREHGYAKSPAVMRPGKAIPDQPEDIPASATRLSKPDMGQASMFRGVSQDDRSTIGNPHATLMRGLEAIANSDEGPKHPLERGLTDVSRAVGSSMLPMAAPALVGAPVATAIGGAAGYGTGKLARLGGYMVNADPETKDVLEEAGNWAGGFAGQSPKILGGVAGAFEGAGSQVSRNIVNPIKTMLGKLIGGTGASAVEAATSAPNVYRGMKAGAEGKPWIDPSLMELFTGRRPPDTRPTYGPPMPTAADLAAAAPRPMPGQPPNFNIPTTNTGQTGFMGGTLQPTGAPPAVTGQYAPTMNPLGTMPDLRPTLGPENHPLYGPPTPPPLQGPVNKPIYGPENMPLYGPENQPVYGPENYPLHGPEDHPVYGPERKPKSKPKPKPKAKPTEPAKKEPEPEPKPAKTEPEESDEAASDDEKKFDKPIKFDDTKSNEKVMQGPLRRDPSEIRVKSEKEVVPKTKTVLELQKEAGPKRDTAAFFREAREARKGGSKPKPAEEKEPPIKNSPGERGSFSLRDIPEKTEGSYDATTGKHIVTKEHVQDHANNTGMSYEDAAKAFDPSEFVIKDKEGMRRALFARGVEHGMKRPDIKDNAAAYFNKKSLSELTEKQIHEYWEALGQPSLWKAPKE